MAFTVQSVTPDSWDPTLDFQTEFALIARALGGDEKAARRIARDAADFLVQVRSTATEALTAVLDLTARGVTFPAGSMRLIEWEVYATGESNTDERGYLRAINLVLGGTTPTLAPPLLGATAGTGIILTNIAAQTGFAAGLLSTLTVATNNVVINLDTGETEIINFLIRVKVGRLIPFIAGV